MSDLGKQAYELKWGSGLSWNEVYSHFPNYAPSKVRAAARRHKKKQPNTSQPHPSFTEPSSGFVARGNVATASLVSESIQTLEQLKEACEVDEDVWEAIDWLAKSHEGWRGDVKKDLVFDEGKISGYIQDSGIMTKRLWSVSAKFIRKHPLVIQPEISPVQCVTRFPKPRLTKNANTTKVLFFSDTHIGFEKDIRNAQLRPYHDRKILDIICQIARDYQPDEIIMAGDLLDMARWSRKFTDMPEFFWTTQPAIYEAHWFLARLRSVCPDSKIVLIEGNHDERLPSYIHEYMLEAYELRGVSDVYPVLSLPHLLDLDGLQIQWIGGYADKTAIYTPEPGIDFSHGWIARGPGDTAKHTIATASAWNFFGHIHRYEVVSRATISAVSFGCCCHTDGRVPGSTPADNWTKQFGIIEWGEEKHPNIETININSGVAKWRGNSYTAHDYIEELQQSYPEWRW